MKYTREDLERAVKGSRSLAEVLRKCGAPNLAGGTVNHIARRLRKYGISTSHFVGRGWRLGQPGLNRKSNAEVLVYHSDGTRQRAVILVRALLERGRLYKCFVCGLREWRGKKLILEIEHKDGEFQNDCEENIEFICPNCHSQTPTFCRIKGARLLKPKKIKYGRKVKHPSSDGYWRTRDKIGQRKVVRPTPVELQALLQTLPMTKIGDKFGVSDNAVRKWIKRYGMEMPHIFGCSRGKKVLRT